MLTLIGEDFVTYIEQKP